MRIPLDWLKEYVDTDKSPEEIASSFTLLGLLLDKPTDGKVLSLEHRMDRSDWLSIIGCARDLAAFQGEKLKLPPAHVQKGKIPPKEKIVDIKVEAADLVRRFNTRVFRGINVKSSPEWLKRRLEEYGMPPINNIVDITNYVMIEYGQPLHAQDLAKLETQEIVLRRARSGEEITTLDGTKIILDEEILVLAENSNLIGIGGILGSVKTSIDETTTDIILDAGNYNQTNIRKTSRKIKVYNETVLRTDKFLHPHSAQAAMERAAHLMLDLVGCEYYENIDYYPEKTSVKNMSLRYARIKQIGGLELPKKRVQQILTSLEYKIINEAEEKIEVEVPYFRTDAEVEDDLVSDVLRINDYRHIPLLHTLGSPPKDVTPPIYKFEDKIRDALVSMGLHEHITDSLVPQNDQKEQIKLENALTSEKSALRTTIYETLYPVVLTYKKHGINEAGIFEIGNMYRLKEGSYEETRTLEVICESERETYENSKKLRSVLSGLFAIIGVSDVSYKKEDGVNIYYFDKLIGKLKHNSFTLFTQPLSNIPTLQTRVKSELLSRTIEDMTILIELGKPVGEIIEEIKRYTKEIQSVEVVDEYLGENEAPRTSFFGLPSPRSPNKAVTIRLTFASRRQISNVETAEIKKSLSRHLQDKFDITLPSS